MELTPSAAARFVARELHSAARALERVGRAHEHDVAATMSVYDMVADADEAYYREQYWRLLEPFMGGLAHDSFVLDVGCGQGRLSLELARRHPGMTVLGVDVAPAAVEAARRHAADARLDNASFVEADAVAHLRATADASVDLALFTEVSFWLPSYREVLSGLARALRPGGMLFAAFRSQYYNLVWMVSERNFDGARRVRDARDGYLRDDPIHYSWHTPDDVRSQLTERGLEPVRLAGVGVLSGVAADPQAALARPSLLAPTERAELQELELSLADAYASCGRYIAVVARKPV